MKTATAQLTVPHCNSEVEVWVEMESAGLALSSLSTKDPLLSTVSTRFHPKTPCRGWAYANIPECLKNASGREISLAKQTTTMRDLTSRERPPYGSRCSSPHMPNIFIIATEQSLLSSYRHVPCPVLDCRNQRLFSEDSQTWTTRCNDNRESTQLLLLKR